MPKTASSDVRGPQMLSRRKNRHGFARRPRACLPLESDSVNHGHLEGASWTIVRHRNPAVCDEAHIRDQAFLKPQTRNQVSSSLIGLNLGCLIAL